MSADAHRDKLAIALGLITGFTTVEVTTPPGANRPKQIDHHDA